MNSAHPKISIVTPSFNMLPYLKLCYASVKDQNIDCEHVVMDGGSTDGTLDWLRQSPNIKWHSERDNGMYNALNKAIEKSTGDIIGHLNCDEQYLPGILRFVSDFFERNTNVDFIAADFLIINNSGELVAFRKSFHPRWPYFFSNYLYTTTCTLFYRRKIFQTCKFDESYRSIADVIFLYDVLKRGFKGAHIRKYFSVFTFSGANLSLSPISQIEKTRFDKTLPVWYKILRPMFFVLFFIEKIMWGSYTEKNILSYSIYNEKDFYSRVTFTKKKPTFRLKFKAFDSV